ncbi:MAG: NHLP bacteriocin system secretion protein [Gammaproteobacteria bacterium]|nr:NHLP bacteriocin system secretion protein [Gammaproteobacteria bacterium]
MNPLLIRPQAIAKATDPEQLDQALRVVRSQHLLGFGTVAAVLVAGLVWSLVATAPIIVSGPGVLLSPAGVATVTVRDTGHVDRLFVKPGDRIKPGQLVALIRQPERLDALQAAEAEVEEARETLQVMQEGFADQRRLQADLTAHMQTTAEERIKGLELQLKTLEKLHQSQARLYDQDPVRTIKLLEIETRIVEVEDSLTSTRNRLSRLALEQEQQNASQRQQLAQKRVQVQNLARRTENVRRGYERDRQVLAATGGTLAEIDVDLNDPVTSGQPIARLLIGDATETGLTAITYLPATEGKKVQTGMTARVSPSTVKFELDGYLQGNVVRVAELPASREGLMHRLKNTVLVEEILRAGAPIEVEIRLQRNPSTPSGYAWTSGDGPNVRIESGTLARSEVVVDRTRIISLVFPAMDYLFGWFRTL